MNEGQIELFVVLDRVTKGMSPVKLQKSVYNSDDFDDGDIDNLTDLILYTELQPRFGKAISAEQIYYDNNYPEQQSYVLYHFPGGTEALSNTHHFSDEDGFGVEILAKNGEQ